MLSTIFTCLLTVELTTSVFANILANRVDWDRVCLSPNSLLTELLTTTVPSSACVLVGVFYPLLVQNQFLISNRILNNEPLCSNKNHFYTEFIVYWTTFKPQNTLIHSLKQNLLVHPSLSHIPYNEHPFTESTPLDTIWPLLTFNIIFGTPPHVST